MGFFGKSIKRKVQDALNLEPPESWDYDEGDYPKEKAVRSSGNVEEIYHRETKPHKNRRIHLKVVGLNFHGLHEIQDYLVNKRLILIPEGKNKFDKCAVVVYSEEGIKIGYLPKGDIRTFNTLKSNPFHLCYVDALNDTSIDVTAYLGYTRKMVQSKFYRESN